MDGKDVFSVLFALVPNFRQDGPPGVRQLRRLGLYGEVAAQFIDPPGGESAPVTGEASAVIRDVPRTLEGVASEKG